MVQVLSRLKERVERPPTLVELFQYTTVRCLAHFLSSGGGPALEKSAERASARRAAAARVAGRRGARARDGKRK